MNMTVGINLALTGQNGAGGAAPTVTYYVDPAGSDAANGLTQATAWQTLSKVNGATIPAGASVLFKGGSTFTGALDLVEGKHFGSSGLITTFGSYGTGKATIQAGVNGDNGVSALNPHHVTIQDLILVGTGSTVSTGTGFDLTNDLLGGSKLQGVSLLRMDISGYGIDGIAGYTGSTAYAANSPSGFDGLLIDGCVVHDNTGNATTGTGNGITLQGLYGLLNAAASFTNCIIRNCKVYNNTGKAGLTQHSGSGILLGQCSGALIENCEAYNNGANNSNAAGPVGIWMYDTINSIIQFCESHHNKTGLGTADGGGFDIDGGCQGCIVQYCYSHDNYGSGYQLYQYSDAANIRTLSNNTIRFNISENDGTQNVTAKGMVHLGTADLVRANTGNVIHNNTLYSSIASANGFWLDSNPDKFTTTYFLNNVVYLTGAGSKVINSTPSAVPGVLCIGNDYSSPSTSIKWGATTYTTFSNWRAAFTTQETVAGVATFKSTSPLLVGTVPVGNTNGFNTTLLAPYKTQSGSPCKNGGQDMLTLYGINPGTRDLFGNTIPQGLYDIGCYETA
ncbi:right-handed parallel beta-helix repeat-containing protein [Rhizobium leguminosarum]|uniref:right-handed parallel beta-helix repeat-containing protein n=1 Tax=Rhizobium leguminosarum TaxID=384 RepID=UPI00103165C7|nr:right-handed parallel beta-helix repeat-containing protein [Rhizobium leguminosarum]TAX39164.1 right-handed parallel beta-helix repeat-containing protein [Rhizobium leguminosarum]